MAVKVTRLSATQGTTILQGGPSVVYNIHWHNATGQVAGNIQLQDATSSGGTVRVQLDTPKSPSAAGGSGTFSIEGGGVRFDTAVLGKLTNVSHITVAHATSLQ